jgi:ATP-dependent helicase IRC3
LYAQTIDPQSINQRPSSELIDQAYTKIKLANPDLKVTVLQGGQKTDLNADVIVASVPTLGRAGSTRLADLRAESFKAVIIDEAHHATASTYLRILDHLGARDPV